MAPKMAPAVARRRAQLQKYVRLVVGAASALCLVALMKVAVARNHAESAARRESAAPQLVPQRAEATAPAQTEPAPAAAQPDPAASSPADMVAPEPDPKEAARAKHASRLALERGKVADAIEAGEQSVTLDPSDAEAWLILGAAYQEKGDLAQARRSFRACLTESKRGPKWECAQMPH